MVLPSEIRLHSGEHWLVVPQMTEIAKRQIPPDAPRDRGCPGLEGSHGAGRHPRRL